MYTHMYKHNNNNNHNHHTTTNNNNAHAHGRGVGPWLSERDARFVQANRASDVGGTTGITLLV